MKKNRVYIILGSLIILCIIALIITTIKFMKVEQDNFYLNADIQVLDIKLLESEIKFIYVIDSIYKKPYSEDELLNNKLMSYKEKTGNYKEFYNDNVDKMTDEKYYIWK